MRQTRVEGIHHTGNRKYNPMQNNPYTVALPNVAALCFRNNTQTTVKWYPYKYFIYNGRPSGNRRKQEIRLSHVLDLGRTAGFSPIPRFRKARLQRPLDTYVAKPPYANQMAHTTE